MKRSFDVNEFYLKMSNSVMDLPYLEPLEPGEYRYERDSGYAGCRDSDRYTLLW